MARLSEEHYKSNPSTPKPDRRSSRFREMFKSRTGTDSTSPNNLTKPTPGSSPLMVSTMKPGFKKIGLMPGERSPRETAAHHVLESNGGVHVTEAIEKLESELNDSEIQHNIENLLDSPKAACINEVLENIVEEHKLKDNQTAEQPFKGKLSDIQDDNTKSQAGLLPCSNAPILASETIESLRTPTQKPYDSLSIPSLKIRLSSYITDQEARIAHHFPSTFSPLPTAVQTDRPIPPNQAASPSSAELSTTKAVPNDRRTSHASNIFDDTDPLSQGIREYVASNIAKALADHEFSRAGPAKRIASPSFSIAVDIDMPAAQRMLVTAKTHCSAAGGVDSEAPPVQDGWAKNIMHALFTVLTLVMAVAAFDGPLTFVLTLWRLACTLVMYVCLVVYVTASGSSWRTNFMLPIALMGRGLCALGVELGQQFGVGIAPLVEEAGDCAVATVN